MLSKLAWLIQGFLVIIVLISSFGEARSLDEVATKKNKDGTSFNSLIPGVPQVPGIPRIPLPPIPGIPGIPGLPSPPPKTLSLLTKPPRLPSKSLKVEVATKKYNDGINFDSLIPGIPDIPGIPSIPGIPGIPGIPSPPPKTLSPSSISS
ncbi:unnamed protein product [Lathyrus oleraceus]